MEKNILARKAIRDIADLNTRMRVTHRFETWFKYIREDTHGAYLTGCICLQLVILLYKIGTVNW